MKIAVDTFTPSVIVFGRVIIGAALLIPIALKQGLVREILKDGNMSFHTPSQK
jgi:hypothetical protein